MRIILSLLGIVGSVFLIKYRQKLGDQIGEAEWMRKVGGVSNVIIIGSLILFFWGLAELTGTTGIFFGWLPRLVPGLGGQEQSVF